MMFFKNIELLWLLALIVPMLFLLKQKATNFNKIFSADVIERIQLNNRGFSKRVKAWLLIFAITCIIIAMARPVINNGEVEVKSSFINMVVAMDMSKSMFANDIYPNRFDFAKLKFFTMLEHLKNSKVALVGFSSQTFLISPLTQDFHSLSYLAKNLDLDNITLKGTDILSTLQSANEMFENEQKKIVLLFTDGSDQTDFSEELAYAKAHNIYIYIYNIGTKKGGVIKDKNGVLKDKSSGNIVIVRLNEKIKQLALQSGGAYMQYSLNKDDIKMLADTIQNKFKAKNEDITTIKDIRELFYYPLTLAIIFFSMALFSIPRNNNIQQ